MDMDESPRIRETTPRARRSHPKSRAGCKICKRRKIKCDEQRPSCGNCNKHGVKCDFMTGTGSSFEMASRYSADDAPSHGLNVCDLELMHNFGVSTSATLSINPHLRDMWKVSVVQVALECDYVLRCMLALSAMHLAHSRPEKRGYYISQGLLHHQIASKAVMTELSNVTKENVRQLHLFSILTMFFALGSPRQPCDFLLIGESSFPDWMFLLTGTRRFSELLKEDIFRGPLGPLFRQGWRRSLILQPEDDGQELPMTPEALPLDRLWRLLDGSVTDEDARRIYRFAIRALYPHYRVFLGGAGARARTKADWSPAGVGMGEEIGAEMGMMELTDAFMWIYRVADNFLPFLKVPTQEALAIFAHFCVLLKRVPHQWWLDGWADHLISKAYDLLDHEHRLWIRWPIEEIGWVPPPSSDMSDIR